MGATMEEKNAGNQAMARRDFGTAVRCYTTGIDKLRSASADPSEVSTTLHILFSNRAQAKLNMKQWTTAIEDCNEALALQPKFTKSLLRRATALEKMKQFSEAKKDFEALLQSPEDAPAGLPRSGIQSEIQRMAECIKVLAQIDAEEEDDERRAGQKWLKTVAAQENVFQLPSGLVVQIMKKGSGSISPTLESMCAVHYIGSLRDGSVFESSYDPPGQPGTFAPSDLIKGWTETLLYMVEGDRWKVWIPFQLGYGSRGSLPAIPPFAALQFEVELLNVHSAPKDAQAARQLLESALHIPFDKFSCHVAAAADGGAASSPIA